jgi:hypothetical protein
MKATLRNHTGWLASLSALVFVLHPATCQAQGTAFTYQGRLDSDGAPANGSYDFQFALYDAAGGGNRWGPTLTNQAVAISNGLFTVTLDFGAGAFTGADRWLEIGVRPSGGGAFTTLSPRQKLTATPYAMVSGNLSGTLAASQLSGTIPSANLAGTYSGALTFNNPANSFTGNGAGLTNVNAAQLGGRTAAQFWQTGGNSGTAPATNFLGTTDNQPLELRVNNQRALRLEPNTNGAPNVIGGSPGNFVGAGIVGATIGGGGATSYGAAARAYTNSVLGDFGTIGGGLANTVAGFGQTIAGGERNDIGTNSWDSAIGGGWNNEIAANSQYATIAGGRGNNIGTNSRESAIGGGSNNNIAANSYDATIAGGSDNRIGTNSDYSAIGGGGGNNIAANAAYATIAGGHLNAIGSDSDYSAIGGGYANNIAGGSAFATIAGGSGNDIGTDSVSSVIGGGSENNIADNSGYATIAGGITNNIGANSGASAIGGGWHNTIADNSECATIPGGFGNAVGTNASYAFAAGQRAKANHTGAFVWGDSTAADIASTNANSVTMRASGGYRLFSNGAATAGVFLAPGGGSWTTISDRNAKDDFQPVNPLEVLEKVAALPVNTWRYKSQDASIRHIGPTAQDFKAAFGVGETDTGIATVDADGVALAAIQGLNQKLEQKEAEIAELKARLQRLEQLIVVRNGGAK